MYVQKSLHLFDFLHLYSYVHLPPYLYDFVQRYYFSKMLHSCFLQMFYFQPKYVISHLHKKISVRQMYVILYNYVYTVKHNDGDDVPSSHHPNNRVPNNSDPNPKTGPSSRHRNHPNPSRNRRTDRSPNSGPIIVTAPAIADVHIDTYVGTAVGIIRIVAISIISVTQIQIDLVCSGNRNLARRMVTDDTLGIFRIRTTFLFRIGSDSFFIIHIVVIFGQDFTV